MEGLTLDTGALVAIERGDADVLAILEIAFRGRVRVTVPSVVVAEWWRGGRGRSLRMLDAFVVEPVDFEHARMAGEALAVVGKGPSAIDAIIITMGGVAMADTAAHRFVAAACARSQPSAAFFDIASGSESSANLTTPKASPVAQRTSDPRAPWTLPRAGAAR